MSEARKSAIELALKIIAILIAAFGIWQYFAEKEGAQAAAAKERSIAYIEGFASPDMGSAREVLFSFWLSQESFVRHIQSNAITERSYVKFIHFAFSHYDDRNEMLSALFLLANMYDQIFYCREAGICDTIILDDYFCPIATKQLAVYGPFYKILSGSVGSTDFGSGLKKYAGSCG